MDRYCLRAVLLLAATLLAACTESAPPEATPTPEPTPSRGAGAPPVSCHPGRTTAPCGPGVPVGQPYSYQLYTHCGIVWAYFDGGWWKASPVLDDGHGNPPRGWGNPFDAGQMVLLSPDHARFRSAADLIADFQPLPADIQEYPGKVCS